MTKLKQVCNHPAHLLGDGSPLPGRSGKLERLEEILDSVLAERRAGAVLHPVRPVRRDAGRRTWPPGSACRCATCTAAPRAAPATRWSPSSRRTARPGIFVLSLKAGGTGLNLTAANHVVHVDRWWNPATEAQATDRAFRIGQDRDVRVHTLVCLGTLEERIDRMIADKGVLAERVVGNGEGWLTTLSTSRAARPARPVPGGRR